MVGNFNRKALELHTLSPIYLYKFFSHLFAFLFFAPSMYKNILPDGHIPRKKGSNVILTHLVFSKNNAVAIIWRKSSCCWGSRLVIRPKDFTIGGALCGHFTPDWKIRCGHLGFRILSRFEAWGCLGVNICSETAFLIVERRCFCKMCKITSDLPVVPWEKGSTLPIG